MSQTTPQLPAVTEGPTPAERQHAKAMLFPYAYGTPPADLEKVVRDLLHNRDRDAAPKWGLPVDRCLDAEEHTPMKTVRVVESAGMFQVVDAADPDNPTVHATYLCSQGEASRAMAKLQAQAFLHGFAYAQNGAITQT